MLFKIAFGASDLASNTGLFVMRLLHPFELSIFVYFLTNNNKVYTRNVSMSFTHTKNNNMIKKQTSKT